MKKVSMLTIHSLKIDITGVIPMIDIILYKDLIVCDELCVIRYTVEDRDKEAIMDCRNKVKDKGIKKRNQALRLQF